MTSPFEFESTSKPLKRQHTLGGSTENSDFKVVRRKTTSAVLPAIGSSRKGSKEYYEATAHLPAGPSNVDEAGNWPVNLLHKLCKSSTLLAKRLEAFYELGEVLHTDFSGVGARTLQKDAACSTQAKTNDNQ